MLKKLILQFVILVHGFIIYSCKVNNYGNSLPGKILVSKSQEHVSFLYENSTVTQCSIKEKYDNETEYSVLAWMNTKDYFFGTEGISGSNTMEYKCGIVQFDISGEITNRIYEAEKGELAWPKYSSWDDKFLIFTTHRKVDPGLYPFEGLAPMVSLVIMDLEHKKVIHQIDSIGRLTNIQIEESPWLQNNNQFVFSFKNFVQYKVEGEENVINPVERSEGVYLYDVPSGGQKLLIPGGHSAIASPTSNQIAFEKDNSIRVLDLNTKEEKTIYKYSSKVRLHGTHWTPDGKHIYFAYNNGASSYFRQSGEKLIEVVTGKEKPFKKIGHGFAFYTWK